MSWTIRPAVIRRLVQLINARAELVAITNDPRRVEVQWARPTHLNRRHIWIASVRQDIPNETAGLTGPEQPQPYRDDFALTVQMCSAIPGRTPDKALDDITPLLTAVTGAIGANKVLARDTDPDSTLDGLLDAYLVRVDGPDIVEVPEGPQAWAQVVVTVETVITGT